MNEMRLRLQRLKWSDSRAGDVTLWPVPQIQIPKSDAGIINALSQFIPTRSLLSWCTRMSPATQFVR